LSPAALVVGEEPDTALDEGLDQVPIGEAVGLLAPEDPDDGGVAAATVGQIERAGEYRAFAGEVDDDLVVSAFVDWLVKGDGRRRALRGGRVVEGGPARAQREHDSCQQEA